MREKKGDLTAKQLITIIILVISFAIIVIFFFLLNLRGTIDKETCRNSILLRGSLPAGRDVVSLECKTQDICLSMGDDCEVSREGMTTIKVRSESELMGEMVNILYDCWWMTGEGKVNYLSSGIGFEEHYCSICSEVYFDNKIKQRYGNGIKYEKIYDYMKQTKVPGKEESYLFYFFKLNSLESLRNDLLASENPVDIYEYTIDPSKGYVAVTSVIQAGWASRAIGTAIGAVVVGGGVFLAPFTAGASIVAGGAAAGGIIGFMIGGAAETDTKYMVPRYLEFKGEELEALNCKEYVTKI